ncbi:iron ABC transporter permease [Leucobacter sp. wl10]|uniref:FecCD family ABC transporter permease n=1 Tax=Leucobacter sp. wl10 TaxID=2304677 RepID=UPI000E5B9D74|nr:iron ABC transporter permease [Leucobacter sp. wl10]RGE23125.1 iron ABC transporter permease [Leucobacter sp. wl10]
MSDQTDELEALEESDERGRRQGGWKSLMIVIGAIVSALAIGLAVVIGTSGVTLADVAQSVWLSIFGGTLTGDLADKYPIIVELRLPRVLLAFTAGAGLSLAGVLMQGLLRNPLVSPFTLGVSPAAAFGAALAITLAGSNSLPSWIVIGSALVVALLVSGLVLSLASARKLAVATLLLLGIAMTQLFEALTAALQFIASENTLQAIVRWTFGSVNDANWGDVQVVGLILLLSVPVTLWFAKDLNAVAFGGDDAARSFGVNVSSLRLGLIVMSVVLAAVVVSFCGIIGFVGLVGPHIARLIIGSDHRFLLPFATLTGGLLLLVADTVGRTVIAPAVVPVGIVVAFIGAPIFINLILTRKTAMR